MAPGLAFYFEFAGKSPRMIYYSGITGEICEEIIPVNKHGNYVAIVAAKPGKLKLSFKIRIPR